MTIRPVAVVETGELLLIGEADFTVIVTLDAFGIASVTEGGVPVAIARYEQPFPVTDVRVNSPGDNVRRFNITGDGAGNLLSGGKGDDRLSGLGGNDTLLGQGGRDVIQGKAGADILNGGSGADLLEGSEDGPDGVADILIGGPGDDELEIADVEDIIIEEADGGHDMVRSWRHVTLPVHTEDLRLLSGADLRGTGNELANRLIGNSGENRLSGRNGDDTLIGGGGFDTLQGGKGADSFQFAAGDARGDRIVDFTGAGGAGGDLLLFTGYGAGASLTYDAASASWLVADGAGVVDTLKIAGVSALSAEDYLFV